MSFDDLLQWFRRGGRAPIRAPKRKARVPSGVLKPRPGSGKPVWRRILDDVNEALAILEEHGVDLHGYRVSLPPPEVCRMNDRIEERLLEMGIPGHVHSFLASTLSSNVFNEQIRDRTAEAAIQAGLVDEDADPDNLTEEQKAKLSEIEGRISLQTFCRAIGIEATRKEAEDVVREAREWEQRG
jgi:hypothetical protein